MTDQPPLDLRSLGEVEEPEVVKAALATFRRRLWTRSMWLLLAAVLGVTSVLILHRPHSLRDRIESGSPNAIVAGVWDVGQMRVGLDLVTRVGDNVGLRFTELGPAMPQGSGANEAFSLRVSAEVASESWGQWGRYVEIPPTGDGLIHVSVGGCAHSCSFVVDLHALGVPSSIWRP